MVTRCILYLTIDTFPDIVVKSNFPILFVGWYLFRVVSGNRYLPRGSNENTLCITNTDNVSVARWVIPLVTILLFTEFAEFRESHLGKTELSHMMARDSSVPSPRL